MFCAITGKQAYKPLLKDFYAQCIPQSPFYPAGLAVYITLGRREMTSHRVAVVVLALSGAGVGALVAHLSGVTSWLDAKLYMVAGLAGGVLVSKVLLRIVK